MSNSQTAVQSALTAQQTNLAQRAAFIANSLHVRKTLNNSVTITQGNPNYSIPLVSVGLLTGVDLIFTINVTNPSATTAVTPQVDAPYNLIQSIGFIDQGSLQRSQMSGAALWEYLSFESGLPFDSAVSLSEGGGFIVPLADPSVPANIAAGANATITFWLHLPVSKSKTNLSGAVLLQTGQNSTPAVVNINLAAVTGGVGNSAFSGPVTITGGTIQVVQNYWLPLVSNIVYPAGDLSTVNYLWETNGDSTNLIAGLQKEIPLQVQYETLLVRIKYFNGSAYTFGTDMAKIENWLGTTLIDDDSPTMRFRRYRRTHGYDASPGSYWADYRANPIQNANLGLMLFKMTPSVVNANAQVNQFYQQMRPISSFGGAQPLQVG